MATDAGRPSLTGSFADGGEEYERLRPGYPPAAVDLLAPGTGLDVVDVGAGTGKLTHALMARGHRVVAVEPSAAMRETLTRTVPGVRMIAASGEDTGLREGSSDVVTYAQAWHWTDPVAAGVEAARMLRAGGQLALVWNMFDTRSAWMRDLEQAMHSSQLAWRPEPEGGVASREPGGALGPRERDLVRWSQPMTLADLRLLVRTRSYYLEGTAAEREQIDGAVEAALQHHFPAAPADETFQVPYVTTVDRYQRSPA